MKLTWLGHPATLIETAGKKIIIDPWIKGNPKCPIKMDELNDVDIVCVTHGHADHLGDAIEIAKETKAKLVSSPEICHYVERFNISYNSHSLPINIGGFINIDGINIHATPAEHVSAIYGKEWKEESKLIPNGVCMGFVIEDTINGLSIYHAGDTGLTYDIKIVGEFYNPQIALLPIGGRFNMTPKLAARAAVWSGAEKIIPIHYNTFEFIEQDPLELQKHLNYITSGIDVISLEPGEQYLLE